MHWRAAVRGSSWHSPLPARSAPFMVFCKVPGPSEWSRPSGRSWPCTAGIARDFYLATGESETAVFIPDFHPDDNSKGSESHSEFIQPIERRHFIRFRERRIVKHRVAKIFYRRSHRQHHLSNVHDLCRSVPNNVHAQQFERIRIEQNLEQSLIVAQHLPFRQFRVARQPALVRSLAARQLFLRGADHRNFRDGVDAVRNQIRQQPAGLAEHVTTGKPPLLHRSAGQGGKADHIARRVNVRDRGLEMFVHHQFAACFRRQTRSFDFQLVAIRLPANRIEQRLSANFLSALQRRKNFVALFVEANRNHFLSDTENRSQLPQLETQALDNLPIDKIQQRRTLVEQRHLHSKRREHGRVFQPDNSRAHYNQFSRYLLDKVHLIRIENALAVYRDPVDVRRPCAARDQNLLSPNLLHSFFAHDLNRMWIGKVSVPFERRHVIPPQLRLDHVHFPRHHRLRTQHQIRHHDPVFHHVTASIKHPLAQAAQVEHSLPQPLARNRPGMNAHSSHRQAPVDDRDFLAHFRRANRALLSRRTASNHYQIVFISLHKCARSRSTNLALL